MIVQGDLVGVAKKDIKANELGALATEGVFEFPKDTSTAIAAGVDVYWDAIAKEATEDPAGGANKHAGKTILAAASADTHVSVKLPGAGGTTGETGGLQAVQQSVALADFTDNGDATGYVDLTEQVPAGSLVMGVELDVTTAFDSTSLTAQVGVSGNLDRFSANASLDVSAIAAVGSESPDAGGNGYAAAAATPRVTVTDGAGTPDFGNITVGVMTVTIVYLKL